MRSMQPLVAESDGARCNMQRIAHGRGSGIHCEGPVWPTSIAARGRRCDACSHLLACLCIVHAFHVCAHAWTHPAQSSHTFWPNVRPATAHSNRCRCAASARSLAAQPCRAQSNWSLPMVSRLGKLHPQTLVRRPQPAHRKQFCAQLPIAGLACLASVGYGCLPATDSAAEGVTLQDCAR
jgi:hypothetical protein